jgi:hypothetical protein
MLFKITNFETHGDKILSGDQLNHFKVEVVSETLSPSSKKKSTE